MNLTGPNVFVADIECNGLLDELDKLHVLSAAYQKEDGTWQMIHTKDPERIQKFVGDPNNVIIGHYFTGYDKRALEKLGYEFNAQIIDTLGLSWYLFPDRPDHGLGSWGEDFGVPKPEIEDWEGLTFEEYAHRCDEDVKINLNLWYKCYNLLTELYGGDQEAIIKVINLCNFLLEVLVIQEENPIHLNKKLAEKNLTILEAIIEDKTNELKAVMPEVPKIAKRTKPNNIYKKPITKPKKMFTSKGNLTAVGKRWMAALEEHNLPEDHEEPIDQLSAAGERWMNLLKKVDPPLPEDYDGEIKEVVKMEEPNPSSHSQVKSWLFTLGWEPRIYKDGANGPVPQLSGQDKNLCESILSLAKKAPELKHLEGLSVAQHRAGVLKGFIDSASEENTIIAGASKFTRTFRYAHKKPVVNIPSNSSEHGELIRICLEAPKGYEWVNADLDSLEDRCKMIQVKEWATDEYLNKPADYDPHIEVAIAAELMTEEESDFFKWRKQKAEDRVFEESPDRFQKMSAQQRADEFAKLGDIRQEGKVVNYASVYGAGPSKISKILGIPLSKAKKIVAAYWEIHKPVKEYTATLKSKEVDGRTWVFNPYTNLWLNYKGDHNLFSACTQNFGAIVHARLMFFYVQNGIKPIANIHDEVSWYWPKGDNKTCKDIVSNCVDLLNQSFGFEIKFDAKPEFASSYGKVH